MTDIYIDGGCSGNPGPMRIAMFIPDYNIRRILELLVHGTNNIAEYMALVMTLKFLIRNTIPHVELFVIKSDSKLVVEQMNGTWKVNDEILLSLHNQAIGLLKLLPKVTLQWIPRDQNLAGKLLE